MQDELDQLVHENERVDSFIRENLKIIQSSDYFAYSVDAILLAHFANVPQRKNAKIMDLCCGNGVIPLLLSVKTQAPIEGIDLQLPLVDMAQRSILLNDLSERITITQADVKNFARGLDLYDVVTCNPPYFSVEHKATQHQKLSHAIARHELYLKLDEWVTTARRLLKDRGKLFCVYRPDRLDDLIEALLAKGFSVHRLQFVYGKANQNAKVVLVEAIANGGRQGVKILPSLVIYNEDNEYTPELKAIYYGENSHD